MFLCVWDLAAEFCLRSFLEEFEIKSSVFINFKEGETEGETHTEASLSRVWRSMRELYSERFHLKNISLETEQLSTQYHSRNIQQKASALDRSRWMVSKDWSQRQIFISLSEVWRYTCILSFKLSKRNKYVYFWLRIFDL